MILQTLALVRADITKIMNSTVTGCRSEYFPGQTVRGLRVMI